jgi:carbohydrate-selective porin OprB
MGRTLTAFRYLISRSFCKRRRPKLRALKITPALKPIAELCPETYYTAHVYLAPGVQYIVNPGYNRDRGPGAESPVMIPGHVVGWRVQLFQVFCGVGWAQF